jgi:hypothetical protein
MKNDKPTDFLVYCSVFSDLSFDLFSFQFFQKKIDFSKNSNRTDRFSTNRQNRFGLVLLSTTMKAKLHKLHPNLQLRTLPSGCAIPLRIQKSGEFSEVFRSDPDGNALGTSLMSNNVLQ